MSTVKSAFQMTRRRALKMAAGSVLLTPLVTRVLAKDQGLQLPPRIVFVMQGNGFCAFEACPESIPFVSYKDQERFRVTKLAEHKLPQGFAPLEPHKARVSVIQGLSGHQCGGGHSLGSGALGCFRLSNPEAGPPAGPTIDYRLGETIPGILPWLSVGMTGRDVKSDLKWSARAAHQALPVIYDPELAYNSYFSVVAKGEANRNFHLKRNLLDFMIDKTRRVQAELGSVGGAELEAYLDAYDFLAKRQSELLKNEERLRRSAPRFDGRFSSATPTTQLEAQFELAISALIGGLSNVATITCACGGGELNAFAYRGIGLEKSGHGVGHTTMNETHTYQSAGYPDYVQMRSYLMNLVAKMVTRLEAMPEGDGSMMDNTLIVFLSDAPDGHHSTGFQWPLVVIGDLGGRLKLGGKYINYPGYGKSGHRTIASFYNTLLYAVGSPQDRFGTLDPDLDDAMQLGPCPELLV